jgi:hypothetical protein
MVHNTGSGKYTDLFKIKMENIRSENPKLINVKK